MTFVKTARGRYGFRRVKGLCGRDMTVQQKGLSKRMGVSMFME